MKKIFVFGIHSGVWVCHLSMVIVILGVLFQGKEDSQMLFNFWEMYFWFVFCPSFFSFYVFYFFLFPTFFKTRRIVSFIVYGILTAGLCAWLTHSIILTLVHDHKLYVESEKPGGQAVLIIFFIALGSGAIALILRGFTSWIDEMKQKELLLRKSHEMEMILVKARLDPHFLFNTINNIDTLIMKDAPAASGYLNKLADIMRFMFDEVKSNEISLEKEIQYMEQYLDLQRLRTDNARYVTLTVSGNARGKKVAPLIFIPFVENAFKYAVNKKVEDAISIRLYIDDNCLRFICTNKYNPAWSDVQRGTGVGNELIRRRLELIYPETHQLDIIPEDDSYTVNLVIDYGKI